MENRREDILRAALGLFLEKGYDSTTLTDIRQRSGASTGSIYHFFSGKADIAAALLQAATTGWSAETDSDNVNTGAEIAIKNSVAGFVRWGSAEPGLFRFMDDLLSRTPYSAEFKNIQEMVAKGRGAAEALYRQWAAQGQVRDLPWAVAYSLMMGPAYAYLRLIAGSETEPASNANLIAEAAWTSVQQQAPVGEA